MFRCPYCGKKAFSLMTKLGINTKLGQAPRCPICKKVSFRKFFIGGHLLYYAVLSLATILFVFGVLVCIKSNFSIGIILVALVFLILFISFNYYFCHFDKLSKKDSDEEIIRVQLKEVNNVWPRIRKGEIYELLPTERNNFLDEDNYTIAMVQNIKKGEIELRVINDPSKDGFIISDELIILSKDMQYLAYVI